MIVAPGSRIFKKLRRYFFGGRKRLASAY